MSAGDVLVQLLSGLASAAILFLVAAGITLIFGAMRIINIAHGSFYMYGAMGMTTMLAFLPDGDTGFVVRLVTIPILVALLGAATEVLILRRIYNREHLAQLLATFALFYIFADLARQIWGSDYRTASIPGALAGPVTFGSYTFPLYSLFIIGVALAVGLALFVLLRLTLFGWRVRAAVEDPELLASTGTNVMVLSTAVFALGAGLAGLAGAVVAPLITVTSGMDANILVAAFIVAILGGLGSIGGAVLGAVIIGLFQAFGVIWFPKWSSVIIYFVLIMVLVLRPAGLFGRVE
jgi:branched-chain amino acid transport system permease protein